MIIPNSISVATNPGDIEYDPVHQVMYVLSLDGGVISMIDTKSNTVLPNRINVGGLSEWIAYDPVHQRM
jgi:DNA-binding beta-propeller fold protein YncE